MATVAVAWGEAVATWAEVRAKEAKEAKLEDFAAMAVDAPAVVACWVVVGNRGGTAAAEKVEAPQAAGVAVA